MTALTFNLTESLFSGTTVKLRAGVIRNRIALQHAANSLIVYRMSSSVTEGE